MCKDNTSIAHTLTDVQNNSIGDSPMLPLPRWKLLDREGILEQDLKAVSDPYAYHSLIYPYKSLSSMI